MPPKKSPTSQKTSAPAPRETALDFAGVLIVPLVVAAAFFVSIGIPLDGWLMWGAAAISLILFFVAVGSPEVSDRKMPVAAGFGHRFAAGVLDLVIICAVTIFLMAPIWFLGGDQILTEFQSSLIYGSIDVIFGWIYHAGMESSSRQASLGKVAFGLRVVDEKNQQVSFAQASYRHFAAYASLLSIALGYFLAFWHPKKAMLHDLVSRTTVVSED